MDRHYYFMFDAAMLHPLVEPTMWGQGFPDWDNALKAEENVRSRYGKSYFDLIHLWGGYTEAEVAKFSQIAPISYRFGCECWDHKVSLPFFFKKKQFLICN